MNLLKVLKFFCIITVLGIFSSCETKFTELPLAPGQEAEVEGRGELNESILLESYTVQEVDDLLNSLGDPLLAALTPQYGVELYKVIYKTADAKGLDPTIASGLVVIPQNVGIYPGIASYQHGTILRKENVPSRLSTESNIGIIYGSINGLVMSLPDYLGLGDSPGMHPYVHAKSEAVASIDMLRATKELCSSLGHQIEEKLLLFGYSQGGHATMALHKEIETNYSTEFTVTASAPMAGPYDMSGYQADVFMVDEEYVSPYYLPYVLLSYNFVYELYDSPSDFLKSPYDVTIPPLFNGQNGPGDINDIMPTFANQIIHPDVLLDFRYNYSHPFREILRQNDLYDWTPKASTFICHCEGDDQVKYENALVAYNSFTNNGAQDVRFANKGNLNHNGCVLPCLLETLNFFSGFL